MGSGALISLVEINPLYRRFRFCYDHVTRFGKVRTMFETWYPVLTDMVMKKTEARGFQKLSSYKYGAQK